MLNELAAYDIILTSFHAIGFNLSNGVTDTLESSTILIYSDEHMGYTHIAGL